jgi:hypothetical protein
MQGADVVVKFLQAAGSVGVFNRQVKRFIAKRERAAASARGSANFHNFTPCRPILVLRLGYNNRYRWRRACLPSNDKNVRCDGARSA